MRYPLYQGRKLSSLTLTLIIISSLIIAVTIPRHVTRIISVCMYPIICVQRKIISYMEASVACHATREELERTISILKQENQALLASLIEYAAVNHYMQGIEELLAFKRRYELHRARCVQILSKTISEQSHTLLIDAGTLQGIQIDMIALYNNVLLGRVIEVYPYYSKVILISDRRCKVAAYCYATGTNGIHEGCNSSSCTLSKVSHLEKIEEQDLVISSGEGSVFPQGFALGRITYSARNELFYTIRVTPLIDVEKLSYCMIISKDMIASSCKSDP